MSETNIPSEIKGKMNKAADDYGFVVPYNGDNKFYNDDLVNGFLDGAKWMYAQQASTIEALQVHNEKMKQAIDEYEAQIRFLEKKNNL